MSSRLASFALVTVALLPSVASAAGIFTDSQGTIFTFLDPESPVFQYSLGSIPNSVRAGGQGGAAHNTFENHISPVHVVSGPGDSFEYTANCITSPTWDVPQVNCFLRLDGAVKIQGPDGAVTLTLTGRLGDGAPLTVTYTSPAWTGEPQEYILGIATTGLRDTGSPAIETLTIQISGAARYDVDGSPVFLGSAIPEPANALPFVAFTALGLRRRREINPA